MASASNKTQPSTASVDAFLESVDDQRKRADARAVLEMMREATGEEPTMWGSAIVGFGTYHYKYDSGREGDFMRVGFSPRAQALTLYIMSGFDSYDDLMGRLGKHKIGKSCLYIKRLSDVDPDVLRALIDQSLRWMAEKYPE